MFIYLRMLTKPYLLCNTMVYCFSLFKHCSLCRRMIIPSLFNSQYTVFLISNVRLGPSYSVDSKVIKEFENKTKPRDSAKLAKPKKEIKTYITLLGIDDSICVTTVEDATKLAGRRNLKLIKVTDLDPKSGRAVYKLMTGSQYVKDDSEWSGRAKSTKDSFIQGGKSLMFSSNASEHDVLVKVKMMKKWLAKRFEVRVVISGDLAASENIFKIVEKQIGVDGRIVQKRKKAADLRFQILPPKKTDQTQPNEPNKEN